MALEFFAALLQHADLAVEQRPDAPQRIPQCAVLGAQPAWRHPSATPLTMSAISPGRSRPQAT